MSTLGTSGPAPSTSGATSTGTLSGSRTTSLPGFDDSAPLLQVTDLNVRFPTEDGLVHAVRGVNYTPASR
jgi:hypothetical protein